MSEPITLYDAEGNTITVYTRSQVEALLRSGAWYVTADDAKTGAAVEEAAQPAPAVEESAPAPSAPTKATKRPAAKKPKGGDL